MKQTIRWCKKYIIAGSDRGRFVSRQLCNLVSDEMRSSRQSSAGEYQLILSLVDGNYKHGLQWSYFNPGNHMRKLLLMYSLILERNIVIHLYKTFKYGLVGFAAYWHSVGHTPPKVRVSLTDKGSSMKPVLAWM